MLRNLSRYLLNHLTRTTLERLWLKLSHLTRPYSEARHLKSVEYLMDDGDLNRAKSMGADMTRS